MGDIHSTNNLPPGVTMPLPADWVPVVSQVDDERVTHATALLSPRARAEFMLRRLRAPERMQDSRLLATQSARRALDGYDEVLVDENSWHSLELGDAKGLGFTVRCRSEGVRRAAYVVLLHEPQARDALLIVAHSEEEDLDGSRRDLEGLLSTLRFAP